MELSKILLIIISTFGVEEYSANLFLLLNEKKIFLLLLFLIILIILLISVPIILKKNYSSIRLYFNTLISSNKIFLNKILTSKIYLLFFLPLLLNLYLVTSLPVTYDEAWTYNNFISRGFLVTISYYPMPNNHVFYSIFASVVNLFSNTNSILIFRLVSSLFYFLSFFIFLKILFSKEEKFVNLHYLVLSLAPLTLITLYQSSLARGYSLLLLLFLICTYIILSIAKRDKSYKWFWWAFFTSLCFFTNPAYLYTHFAICLIILIFIKNSLKNLIIANITSLIFTIFFYFPIIIFQGLDFLLKIKTTNSLNYSNYFKHLIEILERDIFGVNILVILFLFLISFFYLYYSKQKNLLYIAVIIFFIPLLIPYFQDSIAPGRIYIAFYFFSICLIFLPFQNYLNKFSKYSVIFFGLILQILIGGYFLSKMPLEQYSKNSEDLSLKLLSNDKNYLFCSDKEDPLIPTLLKYYQNKFKFENVVISKLKKKNCSFGDFTNYDWVLIDQEIDITKDKVYLKLVTEKFNVYSVKHKTVRTK